MKNSSTRKAAYAALFTACIAILSQISIPLPHVPLNLALIGVYLAGALQTPALGVLSVLAFLLLGAAGVPVFANFRGGLSALVGTTGGYLLGYLLCVLCVSLAVRKKATAFTLCGGMAVGTLVCYTVGTLWFMRLSGLGVSAALSYCVLPFLPGDVIKIALSASLAPRLKKALRF